jgi:hypothetical protein
LVPERALHKEVEPGGIDGILKIVKCNRSEIVLERRNAANDVPPHRHVSFVLPPRALRNPMVAGDSLLPNRIIGLKMKVSVDESPNRPPLGYVEMSRVTVSKNGTAQLEIQTQEEGGKRFVSVVNLAPADQDGNIKGGVHVDLQRRDVRMVCSGGGTEEISDVEMSYSGDKYHQESENLSLSKQTYREAVIVLYAQRAGVQLSFQSRVLAPQRKPAVLFSLSLKCPLIRPGTLEKATIRPHSWLPGWRTSATISFRLSNELPAGAQIKINLPAKFEIQFKSVVSSMDQQRDSFYKDLDHETDLSMEEQSSIFEWSFWRKKASASLVVTEDGMEAEYSIRVVTAVPKKKALKEADSKQLSQENGDSRTGVIITRKSKGKVLRGTPIQITLPPRFFRNPPSWQSRKKRRQPCTIRTQTASGAIIDQAANVYPDDASASARSIAGLLFRTSFLGVVILLAALLAGFLSLVVIWFMLGAVLNPPVYLPYAASAFTFVSYSYGNYKAFCVRFHDVKKQLRESIARYLKQQLLKNLKIMRQDGGAGVAGLLTALQDSEIRIDVAEAAALAEKMANGDAEATAHFAEQVHIPAVVVSVVVAVFRQNKRAIARALSDFFREQVKLDVDMPSGSLQLPEVQRAVSKRDLRELLPAIYRFVAYAGNEAEQTAAMVDFFKIAGWNRKRCTNDTKVKIAVAMQSLSQSSLISKAVIERLMEEAVRPMDLLSKTNFADIAKPKDAPAARACASISAWTAVDTNADEPDRQDEKKKDSEEWVAKREENVRILARDMKALAGVAVAQGFFSQSNMDADERMVDAVFALATGNRAKFMQYLRTIAPLQLAQENILRNLARISPKQVLQNVVQDSVAASIAAADPFDQVFRAVDTDGSNFIDSVEFTRAVRAMGVAITDERALQIFAHCDKDQSGLISRREFEKAVEKLQEEVADFLLKKMGMGRLLQTSILIALIAAILSILIFIFLGVQAFGTGGEFAAVINSVLPVSTGIFMGFAQKISWVDVEQRLQHLEQMIDDALSSHAVGA